MKSPQFESGTSVLANNIMIYYHPKSKGTIFLTSYTGRHHYEWLSFADTAPAPSNTKESTDTEIVFIEDSEAAAEIQSTVDQLAPLEEQTPFTPNKQLPNDAAQTQPFSMA